MKKLVLTLLLSAVSVNVFGMQKAAIYDSDVAVLKAIFYPVFGTVAVGMTGYFGLQMWTNYLVFRDKSNVNKSNASFQSSWMPYAKIAAGLGLTGLTAYLGCKQAPQPQSMVITNDATGSSGLGDAGNTLSPNIMISLASAYTLAPMVPAYFFLKSGFDDLKAARELAYHKEYAKTALVQPASDAPKPTY